MPAKKIVESIDSTQAELRRDLEVSPQLAHLSWVQAREQTGGRGRQGNNWISSRGNLYLSVLYRLDSAEPLLSKNLTWFPLWVGARVREGLVSLGVPPSVLQVKWPNDLYYREQFKLGGVLCEKVQSQILTGIGINVEHSPSADQLSANREVTSLTQAGFAGDWFGVDSVRDAILKMLAKPFDLAALKTELSAHLIPRAGTHISWVDPLAAPSAQGGVVAGLGGFGELHVMNDQGIAHLFSEEVQMVRAVTPSEEARGD